MPKKEIRSRLILSLVWLSLISLLRWQWTWGLLGLWLGGLVGTFLLELDHLLYVFTYPQELSSQRVKRFLDQGNFKEALGLIYQTRAERVRLTFHSALFQLIFWVVCFFAVSSSNVWFGIGLVMVAALQLLAWEFSFLLTNREEELRKRLFWQEEVSVSPRQQKAFVLIMALFFLGFSLFLT